MSDTRTFRVTDEDGDYYEITGDPMESLNAAYRERAHLVALLATWYPSWWGFDLDSPEWRVVYVELPTGQAAWHISADDWDLFPHVDGPDSERWDGHSTEEKYRRIDELAASVAAAKGTVQTMSLEGSSYTDTFFDPALVRYERKAGDR